jgi:hypothetical protein
MLDHRIVNCGILETLGSREIFFSLLLVCVSMRVRVREREREGERERERKIEKMSETAIHSVEREREREGERRKSRVWVNNPMFFTLWELV